MTSPSHSLSLFGTFKLRYGGQEVLLGQPRLEELIALLAVHAGEPVPRFDGAVSLPVFQSSTFIYEGADSYHDIRYSRLNNTPNHLALGQKLAALENAEAAVVAGSGMAAIWH